MCAWTPTPSVGNWMNVFKGKWFHFNGFKNRCEWNATGYCIVMHSIVMFCDHIAIVVTSSWMFRHIVSGSWNNHTRTVYRALETCFQRPTNNCCSFFHEYSVSFPSISLADKNAANSKWKLQSIYILQLGKLAENSVISYQHSGNIRSGLDKWIGGGKGASNRSTHNPQYFSDLAPNAVGITSLPLSVIIWLTFGYSRPFPLGKCNQIIISFFQQQQPKKMKAVEFPRPTTDPSVKLIISAGRCSASFYRALSFLCFSVQLRVPSPLL
jgi:hypothetical protein